MDRMTRFFKSPLSAVIFFVWVLLCNALTHALSGVHWWWKMSVGFGMAIVPFAVVMVVLIRRSSDRRVFHRKLLRAIPRCAATGCTFALLLMDLPWIALTPIAILMLFEWLVPERTNTASGTG